MSALVSRLLLGTWCRSALCATMLLVAAPTQTSWQVGPGMPFVDIPAALAVAQAGDELLLEPGDYGPLFLTKGVTLRARRPGTVRLRAPVANWIHVPAGEVVHLVGLELEATITIGDVTADQCRFRARNSPLTVSQGTVLLQRCVVHALAAPLSAGDVAAIHASNALLLLVDSDVQAAIHNPAGARAAVRMVGASRLRASHSRFSTDLAAAPIPAIVGEPGHSIWLGDCTVLASPQLAAVTPPPRRAVRSLLTGPGVQALGAQLASARPVNELRRGQPFEVALRTVPHGALLVAVATSLTDQPEVRIEPEVLVLTPTGQPLALLLADASGDAVARVLLPAAGLPVGATMWLQAFAADSLPFSASPPVGGVVRF